MTTKLLTFLTTCSHKNHALYSTYAENTEKYGINEREITFMEYAITDYHFSLLVKEIEKPY